MKAIFSIELSVDVPSASRTTATVEAVDRWHALKTQIEALAGNTVELKRMRLAPTDTTPAAEADEDGGRGDPGTTS